MLVLLRFRGVRGEKSRQLGAGGEAAVSRLGDCQRSDLLAGDHLGSPCPRGKNVPLLCFVSIALLPLLILITMPLLDQVRPLLKTRQQHFLGLSGQYHRRTAQKKNDYIQHMHRVVIIGDVVPRLLLRFVGPETKLLPSPSHVDVTQVYT